MSKPVKVTKLDEVKYWLEENAKKFLVVGFVTFGALSLVALTQGIGYQATANVSSARLQYEGHPCLGYFVTGNLTCSFNPLLYPVTHIFGYQTNLTFAGVSQPYDAQGKVMKGTMEVSVAFREFPKNVPYYLAISFAAAFGLNRLIARVSLVSKKFFLKREK